MRCPASAPWPLPLWRRRRSVRHLTRGFHRWRDKCFCKRRLEKTRGEFSVSISKNLRRLALCAVAWLAASACGNALAHTDVTDEIVEGESVFNRLAIEHGCEDPVSGRKLPVIAQSVVFPTANPTVIRSDGTASPGLASEIRNANGLAGLVGAVQDKSIFRHQRPILDATGNAIGFVGTGGSLDPDLMGVVPFHVVPVTFQSTACAKRLIAQVAVADICKRTFPPRPGTANLWIPAATSKFNNRGIDGIGTPAVLTIRRNLETNPLPAHCGDGYDVTLTPTETDVNEHLPIRGYWSGR